MDILSEQNNGGANGGANGIEVNLSENALLVLKTIEQDGKLTQQQISSNLSMSIRTVQRIMKELREKKFIKHEGSDKNGQYIVLTHL